MNRQFFTLTCVFFGLAGCSGSAPVQPLANSVPQTGNTVSFAVDRSASTHAIASVGGFSGSIGLPASDAASGTTMDIASSTVGFDATSAAARSAQTTGNLSFLFFARIRTSADVTFSSVPAFSILLPDSANAAGQFFAAITDPTVAGVPLALRTEGPATPSGTTLSFASESTPLTLKAHHRYVVSFYANVQIAKPAELFYALYTGDRRESLDAAPRARARVLAPRVLRGVRLACIRAG